MEFALSKEHDMLRKAVREFAAKKIVPFAEKWDQEHYFPYKEALRPMGNLGFLGTVIGMIIAFYDMSMAGNNVDIALLSGGIYQAMVTTVGGLIVGIIAYVMYNLLVARIEKLVFLLEARTSEFMDLLHEPAA